MLVCAAVDPIGFNTCAYCCFRYIPSAVIVSIEGYYGRGCLISPTLCDKNVITSCTFQNKNGKRKHDDESWNGHVEHCQGSWGGVRMRRS